MCIINNGLKYKQFLEFIKCISLGKMLVIISTVNYKKENSKHNIITCTLI